MKIRPGISIVGIWVLLMAGTSGQEVDFNTYTSDLSAMKRRELALEIATLSAKSGDYRLSIEAAKRAATAIKSSSSSSGQGLLEATDQAESSGMLWCSMGNERSSDDAKLGKLLNELNGQWKESAIDPVECYAFWRDCVFPPDRPNDAQLLAFQPKDPYGYWYGSRARAIESTTEIPLCPPADCAPLCLVEWAKRANCVPELLQSLKSRSAFPNSATMVAFTQTLLGCEGLLSDELKAKLFQSLARDIQSVMEAEKSEVMLAGWIRFAESVHGRAFHQPLMETIVRIVGSSRWKTPTSAMESTARQAQVAARAGDLKTFKTYLQLLRGRGELSEVLSYGLVVAAQHGHEELARAIVEGVFDTSNNRPLLRLLDIESPTASAFLGLNPELRYLAIDKFIWKDSSLGAWAEVTGEFRREPLPRWIIEKAKAKESLADRFGIRHATSRVEQHLPLNLLEIFFRDAIACERTSEVVASIERLGNPNKKLIARAAMQLAMSNTIDFEEITKDLCDGGYQTEDFFTADDEATSIHIELAHAALRARYDVKQTDKMIAWIEAKLSLLDEDALSLRRLTGDMQNSVQAPSSQRDSTQALQAYTPFKKASNWRIRDGVLECTAGQESSTWTVPLPLLGDFTVDIEFQPDQKVKEFNVCFNECNLYSISEVSFLPCNMRLIRRQGKFSMQVDDGPIQNVIAEATGFPFIEFQCGANENLQIKRLTFSGADSNLNEIAMLSSALNGWTTSHPRDQIEDQSKPVYQHEVTNWRYQNRELQSDSKSSGNQGKNWLEGSRESLLSYRRPLYEHEAIEYEFFYQPGALYVAPCIGRLAIDVESSPIQVHWITSDGGKWWGIEESNRLVHPNAVQLAEPVLKEGWNKCQVRMEKSNWIVSINDKDTYSQTVQPEESLQFGLYHDPQQVKVRVRNMRLIGKNWQTEISNLLPTVSFIP